MKILFADDQIPVSADGNIPDIKISDQKIVAEYEKEYPLNDDWKNAVEREEWINDFPKMRQAVLVLKDAGYEVDVARTVKAVTSLINKRHYDAAIVDLNWWGDKKATDSQTYGYKICKEIDEANDKMHSGSTYKIIRSTRFGNQGLMSSAAANGIFPVLKDLTEKGHESLKITVKYFEERARKDKDPEELRALLKKLWEEPLDQMKKWFFLTMTFVAIGMGLVLGGAVGVFAGAIEVGALTAVSGVVTSVISSILLKLLQGSQKTVKANIPEIQKAYEKALKV